MDGGEPLGMFGVMLHRRNFLRSLAAASGITAFVGCSSTVVTDKNSHKKILRPALVGSDWEIAPAPDLRRFGLDHGGGVLGHGANEPNDHTIFQDDGGLWHLWAAVRNTTVGRVLVHWTSDVLEKRGWQLADDIIRADKGAGESLVEWHGEEFIQSPIVVRHDGRYYLFYGGYDTGVDARGVPTDDYGKAEKQLSLMTSVDGIQWERHCGLNGWSRVFVGPGAVRDPCIIKIGDLWHCYYCGHEGGDAERAGIYMRTSRDLLQWSGWSCVHRTKEVNPRTGKPIKPESPFVTVKNGLYYLFRSHGREDGTYVFCSANPCNFDKDGESANEVAFLHGVTAPELVIDPQGIEWISNIRPVDQPGFYGIRLSRLEWVDTGREL